MFRLNKLVVIVAIVFFAVMMINSNSVLAQDLPADGKIPNDVGSPQCPDLVDKLILLKLNQIGFVLTDRVIPKLDECCVCPIIGVPKTGQTTMYEPGDDGDLQMGIPWLDPRFTDNEDGTVTDNLTGLIWLKDANCFGTIIWPQALNDCNTLADDGIDLTDGSIPRDWRLPNVRELHSLIDFGDYDPALPVDHPFINVVANTYWSSTTSAHDSASVWSVSFSTGSVSHIAKDVYTYVWPVRGPE